MKRIISAIAIVIALGMPVAGVAASSHAPVAGGYGDWPV